MCSLAVVSVAGVTEAFEPDREGESFTRTLMKFENGQTATLEMGGYPGAVYGPSPWSHRVLGTKGEIRVVGSDVVLYNEEHLDGYACNSGIASVRIIDSNPSILLAPYPTSFRPLTYLVALATIGGLSLIQSQQGF